MILCRISRHRFTETDHAGRITCERCGKRKPVVFAPIPDPDLVGRQLARPKTKGQRA